MNTLNIYNTFFLGLYFCLAIGCQHTTTSKTQRGDIHLTYAHKNALTAQLNQVYDRDQECRQLVSSTIEKYGLRSKQILKLAKQMDSIDALNLKIVGAIIEKHGWLGSKTVGIKGNSALFLAIQHAEKKDRAFFLPILRKAVQDKVANKQDLALMEDRVALDQGKKQRYGTQIGMNPKTNKYYLLPLENPERVDQRRSEMGLIPITDYLSQWQINWKNNGSSHKLVD